MRRIILATLVLSLLVPSGVIADDSDLVRAYHFDRSGSGSSDLCDTSIGCPTLGIWFDDAVAATYTTEIGGYVMTVHGNPTRVSGPVWPSGLVTPGYNWRFDGTGDYLSLADDPAFEVQDFSVFACFIPRAGATSNDYLIAKYKTADATRSWGVYFGAGTLIAAISDDGSSGAGHFSTLSKAGAWSANRLTCATIAYDYVNDGGSTANIWVDELSVATSGTMDGPPFTGTAPFTIGAQGDPAGDIPADIFVAAYYPGVLVAADHQRLNRRFRGLYDGSGNNPVTTTAATMPALPLAYPTSGVSPFLIDQPANSNAIGAVASGSGGLYGASAVTNLVQRSSFETWAAGAATGWTETPTGAGDATQNTTLAAHGSSSMQLNCPGAADAITITGACMTVTGGAVYSLSWYDYLVSGAGALDVAIYEDDSADCGSPTGHTTIGVVPIAATWNKRTSPYTMQAGTIRAQLWFTLPAAAAQVALVDALQLKPGIATDAYCDQNVDAPSVCSTMVQSVPDNGSLISANGSSSIVGTFRSPWAGTDLASGVATMFASGSGANSFQAFIYATTDEPEFLIKDAASADKYNQPNALNWAAATDYIIKVRRDGLGGMGLWWNSAWTTATGGAGTGIRSASQALAHICGSNAAGFDVWARSVEFYRRMVQ